MRRRSGSLRPGRLAVRASRARCSRGPRHDEQHRARAGCDEHHDAVDHRGGDARAAPEPGGGERPRRRLPRGDPSRPRWPARHGQQHQQRQRQRARATARSTPRSGRRSGRSPMCPTTTSAEASTTPGQARRASSAVAQVVAGTRAEAATRRRARATGQRARASTTPARRRATHGRDDRRPAPHRRRQHAAAPASGEHELHDLAGRPLPGRRRAARGPTSPASRPWRTPRCTSPSTPPGSVVLRNCDR